MSEPTIKILIIDDNPDDVFLLEETLRASRYDFECSHAERIGQVPSILRRERVDLVVTDLSLPNGFGLEAIRLVVKLAGGIPVVAMTASVNPAVERQAVAEGAKAVISKERFLQSDLPEQLARYRARPDGR